MTKFKQHKPRFDRKLASEGREFYIEDEYGNHYGTFRCGLVDETLPRYRVTLERIKREFSAKMKNAPVGKRADINEQYVVELFVEVTLLDWDGILDENDKPVPFSKQNAMEFFLQHEIDEESGLKYYPNNWIMSQLSEYARNVVYFQPDDQEGPAEKN
jgi:hypothetical protein